MSPKAASTFRPLTGLYEPSAIVQLKDGRFLVVEDEKERPFSLLTINPDGRTSSVPLSPGLLESGGGFWKVGDLEGLTLDSAGWVYAITSQSLDGDGDAKKSREKLVRFRVEGDRVREEKSVKGLKAALVAAHPVLAAAAGVRAAKSAGGLNVEALEISADGSHLWVGFRSPLLDGQALVARVDNPAAIFDADEAPRIAPRLAMLDLDGHGIRGMSWLPDLSGYLVIGGPATREGRAFGLWLWSGEAGSPVRRVRLPGLPGIEHAEGVCPAVIDGRAYIVIVSDDGDRANGRCARYLLLDPGALQVEPGA